MTECEHKTGKRIESGNGWNIWQCEYGCGRITIVTDDGKEQTLTELVAERDELRAALAWESRRVDACHLVMNSDEREAAEAYAALVAERDELRADRVAKVEQWHGVGERLMELRREVVTLRAALEKEEIECSVNETVLQYVKEDYATLRAALVAIVDAAKNYQDVDAEIVAAARVLEDG